MTTPIKKDLVPLHIGINIIPQCVQYLHQVAETNNADLYCNVGAKVKVDQYDEEMFPDLKGVEWVFLVYRKGLENGFDQVV